MCARNKEEGKWKALCEVSKYFRFHQVFTQSRSNAVVEVNHLMTLKVIYDVCLRLFPFSNPSSGSFAFIAAFMGLLGVKVVKLLLLRTRHVWFEVPGGFCCVRKGSTLELLNSLEIQNVPNHFSGKLGQLCLSNPTSFPKYHCRRPRGDSDAILFLTHFFLYDLSNNIILLSQSCSLISVGRLHLSRSWNKFGDVNK